ncbi:AP2-associated kinase [Rhodotorula toruloides]|uniref:non-specific serine/threonine protein kinase n=1 Tax=Rhodotorula toruloides TaxID=5286 RepID=A0A511K962_RHOTO|nr:AP2-associated kinase [Rhodotorula toruloides]
MAYAARLPPQPQRFAPQPAVPVYPAAPAPAQPAHPGTLPPGTVVDVGEYRVTVDKFLSEGGFAHVYLATSAIPLPKGSPAATTKHVLKRMVVPDKRGVTERQLKDHPKIVNMIEASVADLPGGADGSKGYEIYILMEWCLGGGIIDMMNTRLQNRLTEGEILKIFSDVVEAVAHMHYQSPPLIHRDLKVENILLTPPQTYKLCDFGSTCKPLPHEKVPTSVEGIQKIELEINKMTTLQYRAPELVDVWGRKGFDEKIDIWALGVLLYKLCFYTTPFEEHGPLAILNAQYKFPPYPAYSSQIRALIASMLQERPSQRPNVYQVHEMVCKLRGVSVRLENKYASSTSASSSASSHPVASRSSALLPSGSLAKPPSLPSSPAPPTSSILTDAPGAAPTASVPGLSGMANQIAPMRRGRPTKGTAPIGGGAALTPERQVRTGMATVGGVEGERFESFAASRKKEWEAFTSSSGRHSSASEETNGVKSPPGPSKGFDDAFAPSSALQPSATAHATLETTVELPSNASMFVELSPPVNLGQTTVTSSKPMDIDIPADDDERKRFEATFPDIDADLASLVSPSPSQTVKPASDTLIGVTPPPPKMPSQLMGEASAAPGPPLPRRPPAASASPSSLPPPLPSPGAKSPPTLAPKPALVSRGSQTSPRLMADWKSPAERPSQPNGQSSLRQSSIPDLDLASPPAPASAAKPTFDLLGDDDDSNLDALAPRSLSKSPVPNATSPLPPPTALSTSSSDFVTKRMSSFDGQPTSPSFSSTGSVGEREKFRPTKRMSLASNGASPLAVPVASPKSAVANAYSAEPPAPVDDDVKAVEERFPTLTLDEPAELSKSAKVEETWEKVVEKEEADDSSDEETAAPTPRQDSRPTAPAFDDDGFAPRTIPTAAGRPKFGSAKPATSEVAPASSTLTASPPSLPVPDSTVDSPSSKASAQRQTSQASFASSTSEGGGGIDLGPALASIHKFAPRNGAPSSMDEQQDDPAKSPSLPPLPSSASTTSLSRLGAPSSSSLPTSPSLSPLSKPTSPPIAAPKPQSSHRKAAINSLVSRYEGLGGPLTGGPPPVGVKPVGLRKDSTGSSTGSGASHVTHYRDQVKPQRLPQWGAPASSASGSIKSPVSVAEEKEDDEAPAPPPKPSNPTFGPAASGTRVLFKPVPPPGSPSSQRPAFSSGHASRPSFGGGGASRSLPSSVQSSPSTARRPNEEQEERFAGVSNMKNRWENMSKAKDADRVRPGAGRRKEHAAI